MVHFTNAANLVSDKLESVKEISADTRNDLVKIDPKWEMIHLMMIVKDLVDVASAS